MSRSATLVAIALLGLAPAAASAQDTTRKADTAQKLDRKSTRLNSSH